MVRWRSGGPRFLQGVANLLFANCIGYLLSGTEEVEVTSDRLGFSSAEGVVIERVLVIVKLITKTIIGIFEINARRLISSLSNFDCYPTARLLTHQHPLTP